MAAPKRNKGQREEDLVYIAKRYVQGTPLRTIAKEVSEMRPYSISFMTIDRDVKEVLSRWRSQYLGDINDLKAQELVRLAELERDAWQEWERSKKQRERTVTEKKTGENASTKAQIVKETALGDPRYLTVVQNCIKQRCDILGLNAPQEHNVRVNSLADAIAAMDADANVDSP